MAPTKQFTVPGSGDRWTTWTWFHLLSEQDWPTWSASHSDPHRGHLTGVEGIKNVWLGRKVEDSEQGASIIRESPRPNHAPGSNTLANPSQDWYGGRRTPYKNSKIPPAREKFLQCLPQNGVKAALGSGALLQNLPFDDPDGSSLPPALLRFTSFRWVTGSDFEENLQGRVTLTALVVPYTSNKIPDSVMYGNLRSACDHSAQEATRISIPHRCRLLFGNNGPW